MNDDKWWEGEVKYPINIQSVIDNLLWYFPSAGRSIYDPATNTYIHDKWILPKDKKDE